MDDILKNLVLELLKTTRPIEKSVSLEQLTRDINEDPAAFYEWLNDLKQAAQALREELGVKP